MPELVLRSTFIVGFPGETEDFEMLLDWLREANWITSAASKYSRLTVRLPTVWRSGSGRRQARYNAFMEVQRAISAERLQRRIGQTMQVLVDEIDEDEGVAIARSAADAPEIDGNVYIEGEGATELRIGEFALVGITVRMNTMGMPNAPESGARSVPLKAKG